MTLEEFAGRLEHAKYRGNRKFPTWEARCPAHDDKNPSFAVWEGDDGFLHVKCQSGCTEEAILNAMGLTQEDRRVIPLEHGAMSRPQKPPRVEYVYQDASGQPLFKKVRDYEWKEDKWKKTFRQVGANNEPNLAHLNGKSKSFYRLPEVLEAVRSGKTIYINEGEKACEALRSAGVVATCQPGGADANPGARWLPQHTDALRGAKEVVIVADRDAIGETYAKYVAEMLSKAVSKVRVVQSAVEVPKADAYDHLDAKKGISEFVPRPDLEPPRPSSHVEVIRASQVTTKSVPWLLYPYIAKGTLFGIEGDPGIGKSYLCAALATAVSLGVKLPFFEDAFPKGNVLMLMTEDSTEFTTVPRLKQFGADLSRITIVENAWAFDRDGLRVFDDLVDRTQPVMVFIDPLTVFIDAATKRQRDAIDGQTIMDLLSKIALRHDCAIGCLRHLRKSSSTDTNPLYAGIGGIEIVGKYRSALQIRKDKDDPGPHKRCIVTHPKHNLGPQGDSFAYRITPINRESADFSWLGKVDVTADDLMTGKAAEPGGSVLAAKDFLRDLLLGQIVLSERVFEQAQEQGFSKRTIFRAKSMMPEIKVSSKGFSDKRFRWTIERNEAYDPFADEE